MAAGNPIDSTRVYIAAGLVSGCGALFFNVLPVFVGAMAETLGFDESQLGDIVAAFNVGFTLIAISATIWIHRLDWRLVSGLGVIVAALVLAAMSMARGFLPLAGLAALLGIALGALYALVLAILGESDQPDRAFGIKLGIETLPGAIMLFLLPVTIVPAFGFPGVVLALAATALLLGTATFYLPGRTVKGAPMTVRNERKDVSTGAVWMPAAALASSLLFFTGIAASWAFLERIAAVKGLSAGSIGVVLAAGFIICGLGGFCAALIADRWGRLAPVLGIALVNLAGLTALAMFDAVGGYAFGACAFLFTVNFALAYTFGLTAEVDAKGRIVVLSAAALSVGAIIGPGIGGRLAESAGFGSLLLFSAACTLASLGFYWLVTARLAPPSR